MPLHEIVNLWREPAGQQFCRQFSQLLQTWPRCVAREGMPLSSEDARAHQQAIATAQRLCEHTQAFFERRTQELGFDLDTLHQVSAQGRLAGQWHAVVYGQSSSFEQDDPTLDDALFYAHWMEQERPRLPPVRWSFLSVPQPSRPLLDGPLVEFDLGQCGNPYVRDLALAHPLLSAVRSSHAPAMSWLLQAGAPTVLHCLDTFQLQRKRRPSSPAEGSDRLGASVYLNMDWTLASWCWVAERAAESGLDEALPELCQALPPKAIEQQCGAWIDGCIALAAAQPLEPAALHTMLLQAAPFLSTGRVLPSHSQTPPTAFPPIALAPGVIESSFELLVYADFVPRWPQTALLPIPQRQALSRAAFQALLKLAPLECWPLGQDTLEAEVWVEWPAALREETPADPILAGNLTKLALAAAHGAHWLLEDLAQAPHCRWLLSDEIDAIDWPTGEPFFKNDNDPPSLFNPAKARSILERHALALSLPAQHDRAEPLESELDADAPETIARRPATKSRRAL